MLGPSDKNATVADIEQGLLPPPPALRVAGFALLTAAPEIPADILESPVAHRSAVRALLLELAQNAASPGRSFVEIEMGAGGVPIGVARDARLLAGGSLAS